MAQKSLTVFVSSSRDMAEWAALAVSKVREFAVDHGLTDLQPFDYRDIDPADVNHSTTWQDNVGAPSRIGSALTLVLLGERLGTPLPDTFMLKRDIYERLQSGGYDWVHVAGMEPLPLRPDQVPLTGVLFEFFDAFLPRADGSNPGPLRVIFKGTMETAGEPDFGNGDFRAHIEASPENAQRKRQLRKEYDQQLDWLNLFWSRLYSLQQHACVFCPNKNSLQEYLQRTLTAEFLAKGGHGPAPSIGRTDAASVELPGPAPYDIERAYLFFGRGPQLAELSRRVLQQDAARRLVPVIGESGAGKSSLLRAGLLNDARSQSRRRLGWRAAFLSLSERPVDQRPLTFLAAVLTEPSVLPELGPMDTIRQRLDGVDPQEAARRLLEILAAINPTHPPGLGAPRILLVVDQVELALDGARLETSEEASEWRFFLQALAALGGSLSEPEMRKAFQEPAERISMRLPFTVVLGLPADRFDLLNAAMLPGEHVFWLPRLIDETAVREVVTGTFEALGLSIDAKARETLCSEAVRLAVDTEASILPLLAVTLANLHDEWKHRCYLEAKWKENAEPGDTLPKALRWIGLLPPEDARVDIALQHVNAQGEIGESIARLGELAWTEAETREEGFKIAVQRLPISLLQSRVQSGEITGRDFALTWLLRRLVVVSGEETIPDRLVGLRDGALEEFARPMAESLQRHRLLARRDDGTWWLVHQAVLDRWPRAAAWRKNEMQTYRTMAAMELDRRRWVEETAAGEPDADRWLWTRERQIELAFDWIMARGLTDNLALASFVKEGTIAAVRSDGMRAGRILRAATYFNDLAWATEILAAAGLHGTKAANETWKNGTGSLLRNACYHRNFNLVDLLLEKGADPNLTVASGWTPLMYAAQNGNEPIVSRLLAAKADVNHTTEDGWPALILAAENGHEAIVSRLLAAGAEINHSAHNGCTALMLAAKNGHAAIVSRLFTAGAEIDHSADDGETALIMAAENDHEAIVARLLAAGAEINHPTLDGCTALMIAAQNGHESIVCRLLAAGAEINRATLVENAQPPVEGLKRIDIGTVIVPSGDHPKNTDRRTALMLAAQNGHNSVVARLIASGAEIDRASTKARWTALTLAAESGHTTVVDCLLKAGAETDRTAYGQRTALILAAENGHESVVDRLVSAGARIDLAKNDGETPLIVAAAVGHATIVDRLLAAGAAVDLADENGNTPLSHVAGLGNLPIATQLLSKGANVNLANHDGSTPLMEAVRDRNEGMVLLLLRHGANSALRDSDGLSALDIALKTRARAITRILSNAAKEFVPEGESQLNFEKRSE